MRIMTILTISIVGGFALNSCGSAEDLRSELEEQRNKIEELTDEDEKEKSEEEELTVSQPSAIEVAEELGLETEEEIIIETEEVVVEEEVEVVYDEEVTLVASKSYGPSTWFDAEISYDYEVSFMIPGSIPVTAGNAGNHWINFVIDNGVETVTCKYKGGADISKPIAANNASQIAKGLFYHLDNCDDGSVAGDLITASDLSLSVANGDKTETTEVTLYIEFAE